MSSTALDESKYEEYILFFESDIIQEEVEEEIDLCVKNYVFDHFSDYCDATFVYGDAITADTVKEFEKSLNVCWSYLTAQMLKKVLESCEHDGIEWEDEF